MNNPESKLNWQSVLSSREFGLVWAIVLMGLVIAVLVWLQIPLILLGSLTLAITLVEFLAAFKLGWATKSSNNSANFNRGELTSIVGAMDDGVVAYDQNFQITYWNDSAEKIFTLKNDQVLGHKIGPQDARDPIWQRLTQVVFPSLAPVMVTHSETGVYPEIIDLSFTDPILELRVITSPVKDKTGKVLGFVKIIRDRSREITLLKSKNEFITVASHQLRTPITELNWAMEALTQMQLPEDAKIIAEGAGSSVKELVRLTEDLLSITKIEEGHFGYDFQARDLAQFVENKLSEVYPLVDRAKIKLYFDRPAQPLPPAFFDEQKLSIVLTNYLENAVRYNIENGEIIVKIEPLPDKAFLRVSVRDSGIGMTQEDAGRVFTKFFRTKNAVEHEANGNGLGLYIVKNIVQAHGGQVGVQSELNRGSIFWFTVPTDLSLVPRREVPIAY